MLACPAVFTMPVARLRTAAMTWGPLPGADLGGVFAVADVAEAVQGPGLPVAADRGSELGGGCLAGVQAGDGVDGDGPPPPAVQRPDLTSHAEVLGGVREAEPGRDGRGLEGAVLLAAVTPVVPAGGDRDAPSGQVTPPGPGTGPTAARGHWPADEKALPGRH